MVRWWPILWLIIGAGEVTAQTGADPEEVADVLTELEESGAPATAAEVQTYLAAGTSDTVTGQLLGRTGLSASRATDYTTRLRYANQWLKVKGRWRLYYDGSVQLGGAAIAGTDHWQVAAGQLGLRHGFGLLVGAPGRGRSLTADGSLAGGNLGLVPWSGSAVKQTLQAIGFGGYFGDLQVRVLAGNRDSATGAQQTAGLAQVSLDRSDSQVAALVILDPSEQGASFAFRHRGRTAQASAEGVWRRPVGAPAPLLAMLIQGGWRPHAALQLEVLTGWADLGPRPVMGHKHPVFGDWAGQGTAVRGSWRVATGLGIKVLFHRGHGWQDVASGRRQLRRLADAQLARTWPGGWRAEVRWREIAEQISAWSERFPWQPPAPAWWDRKRVLSLKGEWRSDQKRIQILWRQLVQSRHRQEVGLESGGSRSLAAFTGGLALGRLVYLRGSWTFSWGDPVDLVSAVVPFRGYVLPRHWGRWRAERLVGLELSDGPLRGQLGVSWRGVDRQTAFTGAVDAWAAWLEVAWMW